MSWLKTKKIFKLAWRNLLRNRRRTLITLSFIVVGVLAMGLARGYFVQTIHGLQEIAIRSGFAGSMGSAHIIVKDNRYNTSDEQYVLEFGLDNSEEIIKQASTIDGFDYALPRTVFGGLASNGDKSIPFKGFAVDPEAEARLRDGLKDMADRAENLSLGEDIRKLMTTNFGVILGQGLADKLHLENGDGIMLLATTVDGAVNAVDVELVSTISTGSNEVDDIFLLVDHNTVSALLNSTLVTELSIMTKDRSYISEFNEQIVPIVKELQGERDMFIERWENNGVYYQAIRDLFSFMFGFLEVIIIVIVLISCWNIVNMSTMERVNEIGTMRAIGLKMNDITKIFVNEGVILGFIAVLIGIALQLVVVFIINNAGIEMPPVPGGNQGFILKVRYLTEFHYKICGVIFIGVILSYLASFFSIRKLGITEAIDHV